MIVLFTKFDALYDVEFGKLRSQGVSRKDAKELAPKHARESFSNGPQVKFLYTPEENRRPPKCHVCLPGKVVDPITIDLTAYLRLTDMNKDGADCGPLLEHTAEAMDDEALKQLIISTQQTNLELCIKYAVQRQISELHVSGDYDQLSLSAEHLRDM